MARLLSAPGAGLDREPVVSPAIPGLALSELAAVDMQDANRLLVEWDHDLGPCRRPFGMEAFALLVRGQAVAVAVSASTVSATVAGYRRDQVVELARQAAGNEWANRVMIRLWREVCAPAWKHWPVLAAVSYSLHTKSGNLYRFDGWERAANNAGSAGGGTWSRQRDASERLAGKKTLWVWRYVPANP